VLLSARCIIPNKSDDMTVPTTLLQISACVSGYLLNYRSKDRFASRTYEFHLNDELEGRDRKVSPGVMRSDRLEPLLIVQVGEDRGQDSPEHVLNVIFIVDLPTRRYRFRRPWLVLPCPAPHGSHYTRKDASNVFD
jgi:hypothetical protein